MGNYPSRMPRLLIVLVAVLVAGCAGSAPEQEIAEELGLLDFSVPALGGGQIEGADLAGRDVVLWFWAPW